MTWVNFKALREELDFAQVLQHYRVELRPGKREQLTGFCPLPTHQGQRRSPSFSVNIARGIFQCFGCGGKGNVLDFACRMEGLDPGKGSDVRKVALKLQRELGNGPSDNRKPARPPLSPPGIPQPQNHQIERAQKNAGQAATCPAVVNAPLDFELKGLDPNHPYLAERGFTGETVNHFGLGYCSRGTFQGRIVIPIHNPAGHLIGYAGRLVDDSQVSDRNPKYRFPAPRLRHDQVHEFHKNLVLYNGHRIIEPAADLIVVEGFFSVLWLHQHGFSNVVALMGSSCSAAQAALIIRSVLPDHRVWVFPDGDEAGERCAASVLTQVATHHWCRRVKLSKGEQPTELSSEELAAVLPGPVGQEGGGHGDF